MEARYDTALPQRADAPKSMSSRAAEMTRERGGAVLYRPSLRGALALLLLLALAALFLWRAIGQREIIRAIAIQAPPGIDSLEEPEKFRRVMVEQVLAENR